VHPENQQLIWNIINNNPFVAQFFQSNSHMNKESWFKSTMEHFYHLHREKTIDKHELNQLNKEILTHMIQSLHNSASHQPLPTQVAPTPVAPLQPQNDFGQHSYNSIQTPPIPENNKEQIYQNQFNEKKQDYSSMFDAKIPDNIDFSEKETDSAISNVDELIQQQINERNIHMNVHPKPAIDISQSIPLQHINENIQLTPTQPEVNTYGSQIIDILSHQQSEITTLKDLITVALNQINGIHTQLSSIVTTNSKEPTNSSILNNDFMNQDVLVETVESGDEENA